MAGVAFMVRARHLRQVAPAPDSFARSTLTSVCFQIVYDIESRTVIHTVKGHTDDVNAVCFAEPTSSQVLFSGSDDRLIKVW